MNLTKAKFLIKPRFYEKLSAKSFNVIIKGEFIVYSNTQNMIFIEPSSYFTSIVIP